MIEQSKIEDLEELTSEELINQGYEAFEKAIGSKTFKDAKYANEHYSRLPEKLKAELTSGVDWSQIDREKEGELYDRYILQYNIGYNATLSLRTSTLRKEELAKRGQEDDGLDSNIQKNQVEIEKAKDELIKAVGSKEESYLNIHRMAQSMARAEQFDELFDVIKYVRENYPTLIVSK